MRSLRILLPKLRQIFIPSDHMDPRKARIWRAPRHLPQETERTEQSSPHGRPFYLDRAPFQEVTSIIDNPKRGELYRPLYILRADEVLQVLTNTILEQTFEIEYLVQHGQCPDCTKLAAKNTWKALVQVRQKVTHKRTFLYLEQLILKHNAQKDTISIKEVRDGLDFFFSQRSHALKMVEFLASVSPIR